MAKGMTANKQSILHNVCIVVLLVISTIFILYVAKIAPTLKRQIALQKHNKEYFDNLKEEKLSVLKSCKLFEKRETKDNTVLLREIGPIPNGKFISSFAGEGEGTYSYREKYRAYGKRAIHYMAKEPRRYFDGSFMRDYWGHVIYEDVEKVKWVTGPYWAYKTKQAPFKYTYSLTTFDLSDSISSNTPDSVYEKLTQQFAGLLTSYNHYKFSPSQWKCNNYGDWATFYGEILPKNRQGIAYEATDQHDTPVLRHVYYANQRAYMLELHSKHQLESQAEWALENVTSFYLQDYNDKVFMKLLFIILGCLSLVVLGLACLLMPRFLRKKEINTLGASKWLCRYINIVYIINVACVFADIWPIYTGKLIQDSYWWKIFLLFLCAVVMNIFTKMYIVNKLKTGSGFDYLVPKWLKSYLRKRHATEAEYKSVVVFLLYPFLVLGNLPLGLCVIGYVLPASLLSIVLLEFRNFSKWCNEENWKGESLKDKELGAFKDYYLLLDIDKSASGEDIDKAYNKAMVKYNSGMDSGLYNENYKRNVQEAYRVLSSVNRLRPEYDKEFDAYCASSTPDYQYSDKKTKNDIISIQKELYGVEQQNSNAKRRSQYNSVVRGICVFLILLVIAVAIILFVPVKEQSNHQPRIRGPHIRVPHIAVPHIAVPDIAVPDVAVPDVDIYE